MQSLTKESNMSELTALFTTKSDGKTYRYEVTENSVKFLDLHGGCLIEYEDGDVKIKFEKRRVTIPAHIFFAMPEVVAMMHMMHGNLVGPVEISRAEKVCSLFTDLKKDTK
jgi:hypothetical protein